MTLEAIDHGREDVIDLERAYEGVEAPENFPSFEALRRYRAHLLAKTREQRDFIQTHFPKARSMLEACCGNARLLISLADRLFELRGFDIAASRIDFAQSWIADAGIRNADVWKDDVLAPSKELDAEAIDLAVCITGAFGYFDAIRKGTDEEVVDRLANVLKPGGGLLLELYQHGSVVKHCRVEETHTYCRWAELPEGDPFRFALSEFILEEKRAILSHRKTFIARSGEVDEGRMEAIRLYKPDEVHELLSKRFQSIELFSGWTSTPYRGGDDVLIVTACRK